jgi:hypothetical protein
VPVSKLFPTSKDGLIDVKFSVEEMIGLITVLTFAKQTYAFLAKAEKEKGTESAAQRLMGGYELSEELLDRVLGETKIGEPVNKMVN